MPRNKHDTTQARKPKKQNVLASLRFTLPLVWKAGPKLCLSMIGTALLGAVLAPVSAVILGVMVANLGEDSRGSLLPDWPLSWWVAVAGLAGLAAALFNAVQRYCRAILAEELSLRMQTLALDHASTLDLETLEDATTRDVLDRGTSDPSRHMLAFVEGLLKTVTGAVQVVGLVAILLWVSPLWAMLLAGLGLPMLVANWRLSQMRHQLDRNQTRSKRWSNYHGRMLTNPQNAAAIQTLDLRSIMLERCESLRRVLIGENRRLHRWTILGQAVSAVLTLSGLMLAVIFVAQQTVSGEIGLGQFVTFWVSAWRLREAADKTGSAVAKSWESQWRMSFFQEMLQLRGGPRAEGTLQPTCPRGEICFENVSFSYKRSRQPTLKQLSFTIRAGETIAIVGHNGAGKTTLAKLLAGLYQPSEGTVLIDGTPVAQLAPEALHSTISFAFQRPIRFEATAQENIAFGNWRQLLDDHEEVKSIAALAGADELIRSLPEQYETLLGRMFGDHDLSGGQWQKIALARALAIDAPVIVLDEPAANLDAASETALYQGIQERVGPRTTIWISHRFSTVALADRILVLNDGELVEDGSHEELMNHNGPYRAMVEVHRQRAAIDSPPGLLRDVA